MAAVFSRLCRIASGALLLLCLPGCRQAPVPDGAMPALVCLRAAPTTAFALSPSRSLPLYLQAKADRRHKQYRQAAYLLARLAGDSRLSAQVSFVF